MYYILYALFYLLSLLPWFVLYFISDVIYVLVYYVFGYRKKIVLSNLYIAFPDKTEKERIRIAKDFYHNFIDTIVETVKCISISKKEIQKRFIANLQPINDLYKTGQSVQFHSGHFFNWEIINLGISLNISYAWLGVYSPIANKPVEKIMYDMRSRFGTILIPATKFKTNFNEYAARPYALGLAADQAPGSPENAYWTTFFGKLTPFTKGPEKGAKCKNTAIVFVDFHKIKRGYFEMKFETITTSPNDYKEGMLTRSFVEYIENCIRERPANYLWSHRRWKHQFHEKKYGHLVIDNK